MGYGSPEVIHATSAPRIRLLAHRPGEQYRAGHAHPAHAFRAATVLSRDLGDRFLRLHMVKIHFTNLVTSGRYTVWSANGALTSTLFGAKQVVGNGI